MTENPSPKRNPSQLTKTIIKNTIFVTMGSLLLKLLNFLFKVYVIRSLGDSRFGQYSTVLAFVGVFQIFAEFGITQYVMREIARDRSKTQVYFWNLLAVRFLLAGLAMGWITYGAVLAGYPPELVSGVFLLTFSFVLAAVETPMSTVLIAHERFDYITFKTVVGQLVFVVLGAVFVFAGWGYVWLIVASILSILPQIGIEFWALSKHGWFPRQVQMHVRTWFHLLRSGLPFGVISLTLSIAFSIDTVMLKMFHPDEVVGWYNAAYGMVFFIVNLAGGFLDAMVPTLSRSYIDDPAAVQRWIKRSIKYIILLSLPAAAGGLAVAYPLVRLVLTPEYLPSALVLQILVWDMPFLMFAAFCGNVTTVVGLEKSAARIYTINALVNIGLNYIFIPRYGMLAAAVITVVTDLVSAIQFILLLHRQFQFKQLASLFGRALAASGVMVGVVWLLGQQNLYLMVSIGAASYAILAIAFRIIQKEEWELVKRFVPRLKGGVQ